jgi:hypothetical protein
MSVYVLLLAPLCGAAQATSVYRCVGEDGVPRFQQHACPGAGESMELAEPAATWDALRPGERRLLKQYRRAERVPRSKRVPRTRVSDRGCWKKRRRLKQLSTQLRRGYTASQGQRLRDRQVELQAYLRRYCD